MSAEISSASGCLTVGGFSSAIAYGLITQYSFVIQHVKHIHDQLFTRIKKWYTDVWKMERNRDQNT